MKPLSRYWKLLALGSCCVALAACDSRELLVPRVQPQGSARATLSEPVSLGSQTLLPPPNTSGAPGGTVSIGSVPANTWVVLQVNGSVSGEWNPGCNERPPAWPCGNGALAQAFGGGADPYAPVTITYTYDQFGTHTGRVLLRGTGESAAVGLYINDFPSTLDGFAKVNTLTSWDPNFGIMIPSYYKLSGGYTVTATMVPSPFRVTESAPDASGVVTYTAEPLAGLKFINPPLQGYLPAGDLVWKFFPGETSDEPNFGWPGEYVYECERRTVCNFRPPGLGRMQVSAYVEMQTAYVRSKPVAPECSTSPSSSLRLSAVGSASKCAPSAALNVQCRPDTLVVGNTTTCTASVTPATATLTVATWYFAGDSLGVTLSATGDLKSWTIQPSVCGTVTVSGMVDGDLQTASQHIEVVCNMLQSVSSDSILSDVAVQKAMRQYWNASNPTAPPSSRREQGGYVLRDSAGRYSVVPMSSNGSPNVCFASPNGADVSPLFAAGFSIVAIFHTHPHKLGDIPPPNCHAQGANLPGATIGDGPSKPDYNAVNSPAWALPSYVVDADHVHPYHPGEHFNNHPNTLTRNPTCN